VIPRIVRLPHPLSDLNAGELVHYRWWSDERSSWISDGVPKIVISIESGIASILTDHGLSRVPIALLKRAEDDDFDFFADVL
jgi:hypothetical protein